MPSFTTRVANLQKTGPVVELRVSIGLALEEGLQRANQNVPTPIPILAMIDTGATTTCLPK